jgi:hypothetical protein
MLRSPLALGLSDLEVEPVQPHTALGGPGLESLTGQGMTEVGASILPSVCCSCCLCCCCCS